MNYFNEIEQAVHAMAVQATEHERLVPRLRQTPGIINMCFDMLNGSKFVPIKSDKDGGFAFCTEAKYLPAVRKMFCSKFYTVNPMGPLSCQGVNSEF